MENSDNLYEALSGVRNVILITIQPREDEDQNIYHKNTW